VEVVRDVVQSIDSTSDPSHAIISTQSQQLIQGDYVVLATGGLFVDPSIGGILRPCWSYLVGIQDPRPAARQSAEPGTESEWTEEMYPSSPLTSRPLRTPNSLNLFTWGFTHDWCMTNGYLRLSGADHFSSLKPPRMEERCHELASWAYQKYPYLLPVPSPNSTPTSLPSLASPASDHAEVPYARQYGVYSETPDSAPLIGTPHNQSRVCYLLGCNAWGQASLSYAASLVPGLLGIEKLTLKQREYLSVLTIRRYALLPCVRAGDP
jgi:glycine/D-amino acid oxidase-like deaminating enzyme